MTTKPVGLDSTCWGDFCRVRLRMRNGPRIQAIPSNCSLKIGPTLNNQHLRLRAGGAPRHREKGECLGLNSLSVRDLIFPMRDPKPPFWRASMVSLKAGGVVRGPCLTYVQTKVVQQHSNGPIFPCFHLVVKLKGAQKAEICWNSWP
jgi:hypothetical protein